MLEDDEVPLAENIDKDDNDESVLMRLCSEDAGSSSCRRFAPLDDDDDDDRSPALGCMMGRLNVSDAWLSRAGVCFSNLANIAFPSGVRLSQ